MYVVQKTMVWGHEHTQIYYITTSVTYMLGAKGGFGAPTCQTIINSEGHKYNMYVVQSRGFGPPHTPKYTIE
jgi:hypothetical protein